MTHRFLTLFFIFTVSISTGFAQSAGTIAYVRNSTEIRLINPDGTNDRKLWSHPDLTPELGIFELAWKPDGSELAFSSAHERLFSPYVADIYSIRPDGSGLRRITNAPDRAGLAKFSKGSVTVKVLNNTPDKDGPPTFVIYVEGAEEPQQVLLGPGDERTLVFKNVADFGPRRPQQIIAMYGAYRWFVPGVDVVAGKSVVAPLFPILNQGFELHGALRPVWRFDGSRISFRDGDCVVRSAPSTPAPGGMAFDAFFAGKNPGGACAWDWGPTAATANQVIYTDNYPDSNIYQMTEYGTHPGTKLTSFIDMPNQHVKEMHWMPDASGVLYSVVNLFRDSANIFRFDFATKRTLQVTKLEKEFARAFSISPDGRSVVFERCPDRDEEAGCDIWTIGTDGRGAKLLVKNGLRPAWGK